VACQTHFNRLCLVRNIGMLASRVATVVLVATLVLPAGALADSAKTITATGMGEASVVPTDRKSDAAIRAAVDTARRQAIPAALAKARGRGSALRRSQPGGVPRRKRLGDQALVRTAQPPAGEHVGLYSANRVLLLCQGRGAMGAGAGVMVV